MPASFAAVSRAGGQSPRPPSPDQGPEPKLSVTPHRHRRGRVHARIESGRALRHDATSARMVQDTLDGTGRTGVRRSQSRGSECTGEKGFLVARQRPGRLTDDWKANVNSMQPMRLMARNSPLTVTPTSNIMPLSRCSSLEAASHIRLERKP